MAQPERVDPGIQRARTDAGLTGDKVAASDPAAAPENSDAEAAGSPTTAAMAAASAARQQALHAGLKASAGSFSAGHDPAGHGRGLWLAVAALAVLVLAGLVAGLVSMAGL